MNSRLDVVFWSYNEMDNFVATFRSIQQVVADIELKLSKFNPKAEVFQLNINQIGSHIEVSPLVWDNLYKCVEYNKKTMGLFDIAYGSSSKESYQLQERLHFDESNKIIGYKIAGTQLDFGGIGKGIALKEVANILDKDGVENAFVSFGGSSILTRGRHPHGDYWPLTLTDEDSQQDEVKLNHHAVSISGFHIRDGRKESHVVHPYSGEMRHRHQMVQVIGQCPVEAEVLSTSLMLAKEEEQQEILSRFEIEKIKMVPL
ncbi:FAD:protein FMN transferase [Labilibacter sediminis]|nr:FAD:protein FMN transferase [Labilibacter sediminis]